MKIEIGSVKFEVAAWLAVLAMTAILIVTVICATANVERLELKASLNLQARETPTLPNHDTP